MTHTDTQAIAELHRQAFGPEEGAEIAELAKALLALPDTLSVSAMRDGKPVGNVLFTPFTFPDHPEVSCQLLAPLGVLPEWHGQGIGREVMQDSLTQLCRRGTDAVFVLGVPDFYPKFGFVPTDKQTPYPDLLTIPQSWMALELTQGAVAALSGRPNTVAPFMHPDLWDTSGYE